MSLGSPVIHLRGLVRRFTTEHVPAQPEQRAENGRVLREAREGYDLALATVDTGLGGFTDEAGPATVVWKISDGDHKGVTLQAGQPFDGQVRPFVSWQRFGGAQRAQAVIRFGVASFDAPASVGRGAPASVATA